ncbi:multidrug effflux MFS transporter [Pseudohongiella spirulinae]|uniref:Bcr/CflA family efflux transporter n=1 Tax=Pseudohongiella spirulinae TaxID=1249552 RepID=A0A0S2KB85_9GAMM|nr:multidrug effflux MFS transporter [Pseudohongiella spirulinae]ALO45560.1 Multidrug transporter [Pseudohongiella spirulinae]
MPESPREFSRGMIVLLAAASALGPVAMQIMLPAIPIVRETFDISTGTAQLTLSLSMFSIAVATLIYGPLSDRYGRRPIMLLGIAITVFGSALCMMAASIEWLIFGRIVQAAGGAVGLVLARAIVRDVYPADQAAGVIATLVMVMVIMPMLAPLAGGELMIRFDWHSIFYLVAAISLFLLLAMSRSLPETLQKQTPFSGVLSMLGGFVTLMRSRVFAAYALNVAFVSVMFFSFISAAPEIMVSVLKRPPNEYGYYFIMVPAAFMAGNYVTRWYSKSAGVNTLISRGAWLSISGISIALLLHLSGVHHPLALFMPVALTTFGNGISLPNAQAAAINEFPDMAGSASGLTGFLQMGFSAVAAQLVALLFNGTVYPMLLLMLAAALISMGCFYLARSA